MLSSVHHPEEKAVNQIAFLLIFAGFLGTLFFQRWLLDALVEAIGNFRGGPPTHPLPGDDSRLLRRKRVQPNPFQNIPNRKAGVR